MGELVKPAVCKTAVRKGVKVQILPYTLWHRSLKGEQIPVTDQGGSAKLPGVAICGRSPIGRGGDLKHHLMYGSESHSPQYALLVKLVYTTGLSPVAKAYRFDSCRGQEIIMASSLTGRAKSC